MEIKDLREKIDNIDMKLVKLFEERMAIVENIINYKVKNNLQVFDESREEQVVKKNIKYLKNPENEIYLNEFLMGLMSVSRNFQNDYLIKESLSINDIFPKYFESEWIKKPVVAYTGIPGSYGYEMTMKLFKECSKEIRSFKTFEEVFYNIEKGLIDYGVVPIENSTTGGVREIQNLLYKYDLKIIGEHNLKIDNCLLGIGSIEEIREVYSHEQALLQTSDFLKGYNWNLIPYYNTAISAEFVKEMGDSSIGAIASEKAGEVYGLKVLKRDINDSKNNFTKFIVIGENGIIEKSRNKISVIISVKHEGGRLLKAIECIYKFGLNMYKIESKPKVGRPWEYLFYIDFSGDLKDPEVVKALYELKEQSLDLKILGNYSKETE